MALHKLETVAKPDANGTASDWEAYFAGLKQPAVDAPPADWEDYFRLEEEAAEAAPEGYGANHTPTVHPDLLGAGKNSSTKQ